MCALDPRGLHFGSALRPQEKPALELLLNSARHPSEIAGARGLHSASELHLVPNKSQMRFRVP